MTIHVITPVRRSMASNTLIRAAYAYPGAQKYILCANSRDMLAKQKIWTLIFGKDTIDQVIFTIIHDGLQMHFKSVTNFHVFMEPFIWDSLPADKYANLAKLKKELEK